jgi:hypothetical protein
MSDNEPAWYSPDRKPRPPRTSRPPDETLWSIVVNRVVWSCELRFCGEDYGWDARLTQGGEFFRSHRFVRHDEAERWAAVRRIDIERGWR